MTSALNLVIAQMPEASELVSKWGGGGQPTDPAAAGFGGFLFGFISTSFTGFPCLCFKTKSKEAFSPLTVGVADHSSTSGSAEPVLLRFSSSASDKFSSLSFGAFCLEIRTLTFYQLMGFPLNHQMLNF